MESYDWTSWQKTKVLGGAIGPTTNGIEVGDLVSIADNASWWNGYAIEKWYKKKKWYVKDLNGNKATIGKDESGKYSIEQFISTSHLQKVNRQ